MVSWSVSIPACLPACLCALAPSYLSPPPFPLLPSASCPLSQVGREAPRLTSRTDHRACAMAGPKRPSKWRATDAAAFVVQRVSYEVKGGPRA